MQTPKLRRQVFYFHGFDRRGPRFFNLWQKREARLYAERHGGDLSVGDLQGDMWLLSSGAVETEFHFMDWTQVIRARFDLPFWASTWSMVTLWLTTLRLGMFGKVRRADWGLGLLVMWAFMPILVLLPILAVLALVSWPGFVIALGGGLAALWLLHRFDDRFGVYYAARIAWAARRMARRDDARLEALIEGFATRVAAADADEIVLVGHSIGGALALRVLDKAPATAKLLTIGHSVPLVSFQADAVGTQDTLDELKRGERRWIDVSAGRDLLGFAAFDPSGGGARCVSAHLRTSFGADFVKRLRWKGFEMHFLYFRAPKERTASWDWFDVLTGETLLEDRFNAEVKLTGQGARRFRL